MKSKKKQVPTGETRSEHWPTQLDCGKISVGTLKRLVKTESVKPKGGFFFSPDHKVRRVLDEAPFDPGPGKSICHTEWTLPPPQMSLPSPYCGSKALIWRAKGSDPIAIGGII